MSRFVKWAVALVSACSLVFALAPAAPAGATVVNPPTPDPTFGTDGVMAGLASDLVDSHDRILELTVSSTTVSITRHTADGQLDPVFGSEGTASIPTPADFGAGQLLIDVLDRPIVIGVAGSNVVAIRFTSTGVPDGSFSGDGVATMPITGNVSYNPIIPAVDSSGRILVGQLTATGAHLDRFASTGAPDTTFSGDGQLDVPMGASPTGTTILSLLSLHPRADGTAVLVFRFSHGTADSIRDRAIVIGDKGVIRPAVDLPATFGYDEVYDDHDRLIGSYRTSDDNTVLTRMTADFSSVDPTFGTDGTTDLPGLPVSMVPRPDGFGIVTEVDGGGGLLLSLDGNGHLISTFGQGGQVPVDLDSPPIDPYDYPSYDDALLPVVDGGWVWATGYVAPTDNFGQVLFALHITQFQADGSVSAGTDWYTPNQALLAARAVDGGRKLLMFDFALGGAQGWQRLGLADPAAAPPAPAAPAVTAATAAGGGGTGTATVSWTAPTMPAEPISGYVVEAFADGGTSPAAVVDAGAAATSIDVPGLAIGIDYRFAVSAEDTDGPSPLSPLSATAVPPAATAAVLEDRLAQDFWSVPATTAEEAVATATLADATTPAPNLAVAASNDPRRVTVVEPVIRLYAAYFGRTPDYGGLVYWSAKRRSGTTVAQVSAAFAASSEFIHQYGSLTNAQFVDRVYENVLGRAGDAGGVAYWTGRLNARTISRGALMASFSESSEDIRLRTPEVASVSLYAALVHRIPTQSELLMDDDRLAIATRLLTSPEYAERYAS